MVTVPRKHNPLISLARFVHNDLEISQLMTYFLLLQDVDECALDMDICASNASCQNTEGSFECICDEGFVDDGTECIEISKCSKTFKKYFKIIC